MRADNKLDCGAIVTVQKELVSESLIIAFRIEEMSLIVIKLTVNARHSTVADCFLSTLSKAVLLSSLVW
jgi:hypothetical protein